MKITFLSPHLRIAGGVRAILTYANRLAQRGHDVTIVTPAKTTLRAFWRSRGRRGPDWIPGFRPTVARVSRFAGDALPTGDVVVATAWQTAGPVTAAPPSSGKKF